MKHGNTKVKKKASLRNEDQVLGVDSKILLWNYILCVFTEVTDMFV